MLTPLYNAVSKQLPEKVQKSPQALAFGLGYVGGRLTVAGLQAVSKYSMDYIIPDFHQSILPGLEEICQLATVVLPFAYGLQNPDKFKKLIIEHPTYTSGMTGVAIGAIHQAGIDW